MNSPPKIRYQAARIAGYEEQDLLKDLEMPDLVKDDFYTYDPLVLRQIQVICAGYKQNCFCSLSSTIAFD